MPLNDASVGGLRDEEGRIGLFTEEQQFGPSRSFYGAPELPKENPGCPEEN